MKRDYPMMLHRAGRGSGGAPEIIETQIVDSESEAANWKSRGYRATPIEALEAFHASDFEKATLSAERNFHEARMGPKAQLEAARADAATGDHLASVPVTPIKKRGRPVKIKTAETVGG